MTRIIDILQIVAAAMLVGLILLQQRGVGLSGTFGGLGEFYGTRRGLEKILFIVTVIAAGLFISLAIVSLVI